MKNKPDFDLWAEEHTPDVAHQAMVYMLRLPQYLNVKDRDFRVMPFVYIEVDNYSWVTIKSYYWFGESSSKGVRHPVTTEILEYLQEWEYVELKPIGPEDAEWFATDKLLNLPHRVMPTGEDHGY